MKTRSIFMISLAFVAMSCAKEVLPETNPEENTELNLVPMEFTTSLETKAGIVNVADGEAIVAWKADDQICVFDNLRGDNAFVTTTGGPNSVFSGNVTAGSTEFYALYPYRESAIIDAEKKVVTSKLFPNQEAVPGSYAIGQGGAVMAAKATSDNLLAFKNLTSHIRFTLAEDMTDVKSITLIGNKGEALCGLYEIDFSDEIPVMTVTQPDAYVTLSHKDGSALTPGDYFFTVVPVDFSAGFTVILSKSDGSQVAKKTTRAISSLSERNQILPMAKVESSSYKSHLNYLVQYNDDFGFTIGGVTYKKSTHGDPKFVTALCQNETLNKDGVYFIGPETEAKLSTDLNFSKYVVVGSDASQRSKFTLANSLIPANNGSLLLLSNLECSFTTSNAPIRETDNAGFDSFASFVFYDSHFSAIPNTFLNVNNGVNAVGSLWMEDCELGFAKGDAFILGMQDDSASTIGKVGILNNIFYVSEGTTMTNFRILNGKKTVIGELEVSDNTFVGTVLSDAGRSAMRIGCVDTKLTVERNCFVEVLAQSYTDSKNPALISFASAPENKTKLQGSVTNNWYYTSQTPSLNPGLSIKNYTSMSAVNSVAKLKSNPLSGLWRPYEGTFGPYNFVAAAESTTVSNTVGAWRDDMKASPATANYAATNYVSVDYGAL